MKYYIISGEASGDIHAAYLIAAIRKINPSATFRGIGGNHMAEAGASLLKHYSETAFMGFWEVLKNIRKILQLLSACKQDIMNWKANAVILVDYPGFNLRIARFASRQNLKVIYYISPQVWAWKQSRVKKIKQYVDLMLVIFPFEKEFYRRWNYPVHFVGHPLLDELPLSTTDQLTGASEKKIIALLPGSRRQEIEIMLPVMLSVVKHFPGYQFAIAGLSIHGKEFYQKFLTGSQAELRLNSTRELLLNSRAALVTSGTATLETALMEVPQVVCYRGSLLSYWIGKQLVRVNYIAMPNLILNKPAVKELIQHDLTTEKLRYELGRLLHDVDARNEMLNDYHLMKNSLGGSGASDRAAQLIVRL